jgi:hypothetical protein
MKTRRSYKAFVKALWAGLAAPAAVYSAPSQYPIYSAKNSVPEAFSRVGVNLSRAASRTRAELSRK